MLGAIIGDIVGSRFEFNNHRSKDFELFTDGCFFTDDTVMTLAIGLAIINSQKNVLTLSKYAIEYMREFGLAYPNAGYGGGFYCWLTRKNPSPYNSYGNGAAMRVSACGFMGETLEEVKLLSNRVTSVTHNHPEGLKGAEATAVAVFLAKKGKTKEEIKRYILENYYSIDFTIDELREYYEFNESCQGTVPQALECFFESENFEDAIRNAISIGGDSDTIGAITGAIAEAYYGIPEIIKKQAYEYLDNDLRIMLDYCQKAIKI